MIDMDKEIVFRDGWTLEDDTFDDYLKARACEVILEGYSYGLTLTEFFCNSEMVGFEWRGPKRAVRDWYIYYSTNMTNEPEEVRKQTLEVIMSK